MLGAIAVLGGVSLALSPLPSRGRKPVHGLGYAVIFALTGLSEEGFVRGYGLVQLSRAISFWPAAVITSLIFVAMHLGHKTENLPGLLQVGLFGMLMAFSFRRTGGLAFALGFHAAWDFAETWLFGVPDSGMTSADRCSVRGLPRARLAEPAAARAPREACWCFRCCWWRDCWLWSCSRGRRRSALAPWPFNACHECESGAGAGGGVLACENRL